MKRLTRTTHIMSVVALAIFIFACAKAKPYDDKYKEVGSGFAKSELLTSPTVIRTPQGQQLVTTALKDEEDLWLYLPSQGNGPMDAESIRPFWMGDAKLVALQMDEHNLKVVEVPSDARFRENPHNFKPVFNIPIKHVDYRCTPNANGECTNAEEENEELSWEQKRFIQPDFAKTKILEINFLPVSLSNLFDKCYTETGTNVVSRHMSSTRIFLEIERTYEANLMCEESVMSLSELTFTTRNTYSMVKLNSIASKDYEPIAYEDTDEDTFGFFTTEFDALGVDGNGTIGNSTTYMNRWNPKKKEVVYHLSDNFYKEDNAYIKLSTEEAIKTINTSFAEAGSDMKIILKPANGMNPGEVDSTMIVMVEDPLSAGLIGYGPSVANPLTGEIVSARVVMYKGTIIRFVHRAYEELVREAQAKKAAASTTGNGLRGYVLADELKLTEMKQKTFSTIFNEDAQQVIPLKAIRSINENKLVVDEDPSIEVASASSARAGLAGGIGNVKIPPNLAKLKELVTEYSRDLSQSKDIKSALEEMSEHNAYSNEMFNFEATVEMAMANGTFAAEELKPWADLTKDEQETVIQRLLPFVWIPTFVHEVGHTIGLRHNFGGSEDIANAYTVDELRALDPTFKDPVLDTQRGAVTYSSVMDYSYSNLNELPVMGKYDVAAIKFGYARKVAVINEVTGIERDVDVGHSLDTLTLREGDALRDFRYCTDEHVSVNAACNRFDEGTNLVEIAQHYVKSYSQNFNRRNARNQRLNFSLSDDGGYMSLKEGRFFSPLRTIKESYERISNFFPEEKGIPANLLDIPWIKDLNDATVIAGDFMIDVVKTPSLQCALAAKADPVDENGNIKIAGFIPIENVSFGGQAITCFDQEVIENLTNGLPAYDLVAEFGRNIDSKKDPNATHEMTRYVDQIDIRGVWIDKLLATEYLFGRDLRIENFNGVNHNFTDVPGFQAKLESLAIDLALDDVISEGVEFRDASGATVLIGNVSTEQLESNQFEDSFSSRVNNRFSVKENRNYLLKHFFGELKHGLPNHLDNGEGNMFVRALDVHTSTQDFGSNEDVEAYKSPFGNFYAVKGDNVLAEYLIIQARNATETIQQATADLAKAKPVVDALPFDALLAMVNDMNAQAAAGVEEPVPPVEGSELHTQLLAILVTPETGLTAEQATELILEAYIVGAPLLVAQFQGAIQRAIDDNTTVKVKMDKTLNIMN